MLEFFKQFFRQARGVFVKLDAKQKAVVLIVSVLSVFVIIYLMTWTGQKQFTVLQSNLQPEDAKRIIDFLDEKKIEHKLETEGTAILVPQGTELDLRLEIVSKGLITGGIVGYEIFDRPNIGMTDFLQQVNYKRALEGELSRTIRSLDIVHQAQVRIVTPKTSLFVQDQKPTTASVIVTLKPGKQLTAEQIKTIANLVSHSVEGLIPANVMISDSYANNLSKVISKDPLLSARAEQIELQNSRELDMKSKIEATLAEVLGPSNAVVNVAVEMDFTQTVKDAEMYDPASQVVLSEERESNAGAVQDTLGKASSGDRTITNYVMNKTMLHSKEEFGKIKKITASVLVNGRFTKDPDGTLKYNPRSPEELTSLRQSVINTIGADETRGDLISVLDYQFDRTITTKQEQDLKQQQFNEMFKNVLKWGLMAFAGILFLFVLRSVFRSLDLLLPKPKPKPAIDIEAEAIEEEISAEAQRRAQMLDQVSRFTKEKPSNVASLLNTWLVEEKS
jgi:flagellar M-ring protein FliF